MLDPASRFRRFARAVTTEVGALDQFFLGCGRPLGEARVLNAIGKGISEVGALRAFLRLDSGLMSRSLRSLEAEDLIRMRTDKCDARRRVASLTAAGKREFKKYEQISNSRANTLLSQFRRPEELLAALDLVASALGCDRIEVRVVDPRESIAQYCLERYYEEVAKTFEGGFDLAQSHPPRPEQMLAPKGAFLVAVSDELPIGCVGLKGNGTDIAEVKRLWVSPAARGLGLAHRLMEEVEAAGRKLSIATLRLDTNKAMTRAQQLYKKMGWIEIEAYNDNPYADYFFEKKIILRA